MRLSRDRMLLASGVLLAAGVATLCVRAEMAPWMQTAVSGSSIEAALYRMMELPGLRTLYRRPPAEARGELDKLVAGSPQEAQLYALRAHVEEQALDFAAAERDWKSYAEHAQDKGAAGFELADFYRRRNLGPQEIAALESAAAIASPESERFLPADRQRAWQAFPRALGVVRDQALGDDAAIAVHNAWIDRYPAEPAVRGEFVSALLQIHRYDDAQRAIDDYRAAFPQDQIFPIKAEALLAFRKGTPDATAQALAAFEKQYQPLWPADLISAYFELLDATHTRHAMLMAARAELVRNPDDLTAATKLFHSYQQQGRTDAALTLLSQYGASKETRHATWSADELYTFARLLDGAAQYPEAARYYYALAASKGTLSGNQSAAEAGLSGLTRILLVAPDQPVAFGSGNLSLYRDVATLDNGPGYLNGILSLWLNSQDPASEFHAEEQKATPYFHRQKAAELLGVIDQRFPSASARPELHAAMVKAYMAYRQDSAVKEAGERFLAAFPNAPQRLEIALEVADADARTNDTQAEFALYDRLLAELSAPLHGMALTAAGTPEPRPQAIRMAETDDVTPDSRPAAVPEASVLLENSLKIPVAERASSATAKAYRQVLDRYIGRLLATRQPLAALALLRRELDRNPDDPLFYERLAAFLQQNDLAEQEEEVYQRAITRFNNTNFYDKLARFYLRRQRRQDFDALTRKIVDIFQGTELEQYFRNVDRTWPQEYLQLNLYAHQRFPHDLVFTRNLFSAYQDRRTADRAAYERLLREHWDEAPDLQATFFHMLSRTGRLRAELTELEKLVPSGGEQQQNPAATRELAEIRVWQSHFEQGAPLLAQLAGEYPGESAVGEEAASVLRSLAYFNPAQVARAVKIEQQLADADPRSLDRLASIGDTYADSTAASMNLDTAQQLADAAPFWRRMAEVHPGIRDGYLQSATVFWDYFQYDDALAQIQPARIHFRDPALFGYQAGAILEGKRDTSQAVTEYVTAATAGGDDGSAHARLVELARRPLFANGIDAATESAVTTRPSVAALQLRADVLSELHRRQDLQPVVEDVIARAGSIQEVSELAAFSQSHQLPGAYRTALQREVSLTTDPIQRIQLQYELARAWQDAGDIPEAQRVIEAVYNSGTNSRILGVVRATTDFYWNNKQPQRAIATLMQASHAANAELGHEFLLEAVTKSNQSGDFAGARTRLQPLLAGDPFNPQYLNMEAASFSLAHDSAGLRDFYMRTLDAVRATPMAATDKRDKIALVRQGLIPALTDLKNYWGAMEQHAALISAFPEDAGILQAATSYARRYGMEPALVAFLKKAVADSPRDSRFAIDLGRVDVQFEDYAGALEAYSKAIAIRSDRPDLYIARADIEEHQQAYDAVCSDYERLYLLTYKDTQWMEKEALARARQGRPELAVKALETAWLEGHTPTAADYFQIAEQFEKWDMLAQSESFASQGIKLAGDDLLAEPDYFDGVSLYARVAARERKAAETLALLTQRLQAVSASSSSPSIIIRQIETKGLASVTDSQWRGHLAEARRRQAQSGYRKAILEMSNAAGAFYTPEEKAGYATLLDAKRSSASLNEVVELWIPAASAAGLKDREAAWRRDVLLSGGELASSQVMPFIELENSRMEYATLGEALDAYAGRVRPSERIGVLSMAAAAWRDAGNREREIADLRMVVASSRQVQFEQRLFQLYLRGDPEALLQLTSLNSDLGDDAANYLLAHGTQPQVYRAIANHGSQRPAVWNSATRALAGLYFGDLSGGTGDAFQAALANESIGRRLQTKPDESAQIVGPQWFYYGSRYGYFLTLSRARAHDPEDFLPADLELSSTNPASFYALAATYLDARSTDAALAEFRHVVELDPADPTANVSMAEALWSSARHDAALSEWNQALSKLRAMVNLRAVPESFWTCFARIANDASRNRIALELKPGMDAVVTAYVRKNGNYRSAELLHSGYIALGGQSKSEAAKWIIATIGAMAQTDQMQALSMLMEQPWFPALEDDAVFGREMELAQSELQSAGKSPDDKYSNSRLREIQIQYIRWLLRNQRTAEAQRVFDSIESSQRQTQVFQEIEILLAAKQGRIASLLARYQDDPLTAPPLFVLSGAANTLRLSGDQENARAVLEYAFDQKLRSQTLSAPDYLGLAEAHLNTGDVAGARDLLQRLILQGDLYENLDSAASLLVRTGHTAEALPFLKKLAAGVPWSADYRLRLGQAQLALKQLTDSGDILDHLASDDHATYAIRAVAAGALHDTRASSKVNSSELALLASGAATPKQAAEPYFVYAQILAASNASPQQSVVMLRAAVQSAPSSMLNWLRVRIFQAEAAQNDYERARTAISPVLENGGALLFSGRRQSYGEEDVERADELPGSDRGSEPASNSGNEPYAVSTLLGSKEQQRAFFVTLANVDEHLEDLRQAVNDLQSAVRVSSAGAQTSILSGRITGLQRRIRIEQDNRARRPVIGKSIEQSIRVRPRVSISAARVQR